MVKKLVLINALRKCRICGIEAHNEDELEPFVKNTTRSPYGRQNLCKKCHVAEYHKWKVNHTRRFLGHGHFRNKLIAYLGGKCMKCGNIDSRVLECHAPNGHGIPHNERSVYKFWKQRDELMLLCANCHRIEHYLENLKQSGVHTDKNQV